MSTQIIFIISSIHASYLGQVSFKSISVYRLYRFTEFEKTIPKWNRFSYFLLWKLKHFLLSGPNQIPSNKRPAVVLYPPHHKKLDRPFMNLSSKIDFFNKKWVTAKKENCIFFLEELFFVWRHNFCHVLTGYPPIGNSYYYYLKNVSLTFQLNVLREKGHRYFNKISPLPAKG